ncbi:MAG: transcriptional repressor [Ruminococcaceae bacterium]|nr:transcriptional repressor [Oscillospiraceae bacterium]
MKNDYETRQKTAILDFLRNCDGHITASGIVKGLSEQGVRIGTATVYRHLEKLENKGMIRKYITDRGACYQYAGDCGGNHFHLKCTQCGTLLHIDCAFLEKLAPHILEHHNFKVDNFRTVMYGKCENCARGGESL